MTGMATPGVTSYETPSANQVRITRVVAAPRALVFEAWTQPRHLTRWLSGWEGWTMPVCELDLRPGGSWRYVWRSGDGTEMSMGGTVVEVMAPERLVTTERWGPEWPETTNVLTLVESGGLTTVTLTITYPDQAARDAALRTGMKEGMELSFGRFDALLESLVSG